MKRGTNYTEIWREKKKKNPCVVRVCNLELQKRRNRAVAVVVPTIGESTWDDAVVPMR